MWQLGSKTPNFTLEGHEKGVNCIDYYSGGDKPYLVSGADDHLVKIWDYQVPNWNPQGVGLATVSQFIFHTFLWTLYLNILLFKWFIISICFEIVPAHSFSQQLGLGSNPQCSLHWKCFLWKSQAEVVTLRGLTTWWKGSQQSPSFLLNSKMFSF